MSNRDDLILPQPEKMEVVVTDIRMPFASMVGFMVKWALAAIPAMIILGFIGMILSAFFMAFIGAGMAS